jgi:undecaprenyl diphosphate synthase
MNLLENIDQNKFQTFSHYYGWNGRWAKQQGLSFGHESGTKSVKIIIETCANLALKSNSLCLFN